MIATSGGIVRRKVAHAWRSAVVWLRAGGWLWQRMQTDPATTEQRRFARAASPRSKRCCKATPIYEACQRYTIDVAEQRRQVAEAIAAWYQSVLRMMTCRSLQRWGFDGLGVWLIFLFVTSAPSAATQRRNRTRFRSSVAQLAAVRARQTIAWYDNLPNIIIRLRGKCRTWPGLFTPFCYVGSAPRSHSSAYSDRDRRERSWLADHVRTG